MNTTGALIILAFILAALGGGIQHGKRLATAECERERLASVNRAIEQGRALAAQELERAEQGARVLTRVKTEIRYVEREIAQSYTPDCTDLGPAWLRHYNAAIDAANLPGAAAPADAAAGAGAGADQFACGDWGCACPEHGRGGRDQAAAHRADPGREGAAGFVR